jgi:YVTN family beta-propeller protein
MEAKSMRRKAWAWFACAVSCATTGTVPAQYAPYPAADYTVSRSFTPGGTGSWDHLVLDPSGGRLFVARGDRVDVVDTSTGRATGSIQHTLGVHSVAFAPALRRGFTSNGGNNTVTVFDLDTLRVITEVPVAGSAPDGILFEPQTNHVIVANRESANLTILDAGSMQVTGTVALPAAPEGLVTDGVGTLFVNLDLAPGKLVAINAKTLKIRATWPLKECANPTGLGIDPGNHRLFSVCANQVLAVTDSLKGRAGARVVIGRGSDSVVFDPELGLVFSSNGIDGTLTVIQQLSPDEYRVHASVTTQVSAHTMALDLGTHRIYLAAAQFGPPPPAPAGQPPPRAAVIPGSFTILVAQPR